VAQQTSSKTIEDATFAGSVGIEIIYVNLFTI